MKAGYSASGSTTMDRTYMDLFADYNCWYLYPDIAKTYVTPCNGFTNSPTDWTCPVPGTDCVQCPDAAIPHHYCTFSRRTFTTKSTATAKSMYLKSPLYYAAKWGGFSDADIPSTPGYNIPNSQTEWDKTGDGVPDNYFFVANPNELFSSLDKAFSQVLLREGAAGAVATVTQEVHQGDIVVRAAFESYDPANPSYYTWYGHLESFRPFAGCSSFTSQASCNSTSGCNWSGGACNGTLYGFQLNPGKFCVEMPSATANCLDGGVVLNSQIASDRKIFTTTGTTTKTYISALDNSTLKVHTDLDGGGVGASDWAVLKNWIQGDNATYSNLRNRHGWRLGDIVYSTPVALGPPSISAVPRPLADANFRTYLSNPLHQYRDQMAYVGANDGMLHAFYLGIWDNSTKEYNYANATNVGRSAGRTFQATSCRRCNVWPVPTTRRLPGQHHVAIVSWSTCRRWHGT